MFDHICIVCLYVFDDYNPSFIYRRNVFMDGITLPSSNEFRKVCRKCFMLSLIPSRPGYRSLGLVYQRYIFQTLIEVAQERSRR